MSTHDRLADLWDCVDSFDEESADLALAGLLWDVPLTDALTSVVIPFLQQIGERWDSGRLSVAHEHFASNLLRRRLSALGDQMAPVDAGAERRPLALLACPSGERHDLVLLCFALLLGQSGWRTLFLGADTPSAAIVSAARAASVDAVVLASTRSTALTAKAESLRRLSATHPVYVAGRGADEEVARTVGARLLPGDPVAAVEVLTEANRAARLLGDRR